MLFRFPPAGASRRRPFLPRLRLCRQPGGDRQAEQEKLASHRSIFLFGQTPQTSGRGARQDVAIGAANLQATSPLSPSLINVAGRNETIRHSDIHRELGNFRVHVFCES
jgi:hypothetical protein